MSLESDISSLVRSVGLELYDTVVVNENDATVFRVNIVATEVIDGKRKGVTLDECVALTHLISPLLDVTPPLSGDYRLEVGTPGIERKLLTLNHFQKSIGEMVALTTSKKEKIRGVLEDVQGSTIYIKTAQESLELDFHDISKAKTYFEW